MSWPIRFGIVLLFLLAARSSALGYEKDVHFSLTFAACVASGCTYAEALDIASANERIDENDTTTASVTVALDPKSPEAQKRRMWHALDDSRENVLKRLEELSVRAFGSRSLVDFGQYLHFLQDHFSHREAKGENWRPYGWKVGHAVRAHQPDRVPSDRRLAEEMVAATLDAVARFRRETLERQTPTPNPEVPAKLVAALSASYRRDSLGFWNEADSYKVPINLEEALGEAGLTEPHIPHIERIIKMRFDRDGARLPTH